MINPDYIPATTKQRQFALADNELQGRTIAITGATGGLGTALAKSLAHAGATVVLISRKEKKLDKLYDVLVANGAPTPAIVPIEHDKASEAAYVELAELLYREFGGLDALVHTAADLGGHLALTQSVHAWQPGVFTGSQTRSLLGRLWYIQTSRPGVHANACRRKRSSE